MTSSMSFASMPGTKSVTESIDRRQSASTRWPSLLQRSCSARSVARRDGLSEETVPSAFMTPLHFGKSTSGPPLTSIHRSSADLTRCTTLSIHLLRELKGISKIFSKDPRREEVSTPREGTESSSAKRRTAVSVASPFTWRSSTGRWAVAESNFAPLQRRAIWWRARSAAGADGASSVEKFRLISSTWNSASRNATFWTDCAHNMRRKTLLNWMYVRTILPTVSVPVLSEQRTDMHPRVSMVARFFTSTLRLAIRLATIVSESATQTGKPCPRSKINSAQPTSGEV